MNGNERFGMEFIYILDARPGENIAKGMRPFAKRSLLGKKGHDQERNDENEPDNFVKMIFPVRNSLFSV
jgi:hypothetical protein